MRTLVTLVRLVLAQVRLSVLLIPASLMHCRAMGLLVSRRPTSQRRRQKKSAPG